MTAPRSQATDFTPGEPNTGKHRYPERQPAQQKRSGQSDLDGHPEEVEHAHRARFEGSQANRHRSDRGRHRGHDEADENHPNLWHITDGVEHEPKRKSIEQEDPKLEAHCLSQQDGAAEEIGGRLGKGPKRSGRAEQPVQPGDQPPFAPPPQAEDSGGNRNRNDRENADPDKERQSGAVVEPQIPALPDTTAR